MKMEAKIKEEEGAQLKEERIQIRKAEEETQIKKEERERHIKAEEAQFKEEDEEENDTITPLFRIPLNAREQPEHGVSDNGTSSLPIVIVPMDSTDMPEKRGSELCDLLAVNPVSSSGNPYNQKEEPAILEVIAQRPISPHIINKIAFVEQSQPSVVINDNAANAAYSTRQRLLSGLEKVQNACIRAKTCTVQPCARQSFPSQDDYLKHCIDVHGVRKELLKTQNFSDLHHGIHEIFLPIEPDQGKGSKKCTVQPCTRESFPSQHDYLTHCVEVHGVNREILKTQLAWVPPEPNLHFQNPPKSPNLPVEEYTFSSETLGSYTRHEKKSGSLQQNKKCQECRDIYLPMISDPTKHPHHNVNSKFFVHRHKNSVYRCPFCEDSESLAFDQPWYLLWHVDAAHTDKKHTEPVCKMCRDIYKPLISAAKRHQPKDMSSDYHTHRHKSGRYTCPFCVQAKSLVFGKPEHLLDHIKAMHVPIPVNPTKVTKTASYDNGVLGNQSIEEKCQECKDIYLSIISDPAKHPRYDGSSGFHVHRHENDVYLCPFCMESELLRFNEPWDLLGHIEVAHTQHKEKPKKPSKPLNIINKNHRQSVCLECRKIFGPMLSYAGYDPSKDKSSGYRNHRHKISMYTCPFCLQSKTPILAYKKQLLDHVKTFHASINKPQSIPVDNPINAPECPRNCSRDSFRSNFAHMIHCSNVHGIKLEVLRPVMHNIWPCSDCEKIYLPLLLDSEKDPSKDKQSAYHTHRHENGLYTCPICSISKSSVFSQPKHLLGHVKAAHTKVPKVTNEPKSDFEVVKQSNKEMCKECANIYLPMISDPKYRPYYDVNSKFHGHRHKDGVYWCPFCLDSACSVFTEPWDLLAHIKTVHVTKTSDRDSQQLQDIRTHFEAAHAQVNSDDQIHGSSDLAKSETVVNSDDINMFKTEQAEPKYTVSILKSRDTVKLANMPSLGNNDQIHGSSDLAKSETVVNPDDINMFKPEQAEPNYTVSILKTQDPVDLANTLSLGNKEQTLIKMEPAKMTDKGDDNLGYFPHVKSETLGNSGDIAMSKIEPTEPKYNVSTFKIRDPHTLAHIPSGFVIQQEHKPCPLLPKSCNRDNFRSSIEWMIHCKQYHKDVIECDFCLEFCQLQVENPTLNLSQKYDLDRHKHKPEIYRCPLCPTSSNLFFERFGYLKRHLNMAHIRSPPPEPWSQPSSLLHHNVEALEAGGNNSNIHKPILECAKRKLVADAETIPVKITRILQPKNAGAETVLPITWTQPSSLLHHQNNKVAEPTGEKNIKIVMPKTWTQASSLLRCLAVEAESDPAGEKTVKVVSANELNFNTQAPVGGYAKRQLVGNAKAIPINIAQVPQPKNADMEQAQNQSLTVGINELLSTNTTIGEELAKRQEMAGVDDNTATTIMPLSIKK